MPPQSDEASLRPTVSAPTQMRDAKAEDRIQKYGFDPYVYRWIWRRVIGATWVHIFNVFAIYWMATFECHLWTVMWMIVCMYVPGWSVTAGAHRLWSHRAYKAKAPYRYLMAVLFTMANQQDLFTWVRDHRIHHKYTDTDMDPHNSKRSFFFCHTGWLFTYPHPEVLKAYAKADLSDLEKDPAACFQRKYHAPLAIFLCYFFPTIVPYYLWGENLIVSYAICAMLRYTTVLHGTSAINSFAHYYGDKPYDKSLTATNSLLNNAFIWGLGEGWHNYHHVFPFDYRASELPYLTNTTTMFIDFMAWCGQVYDCKVVSQEAIDARKWKNEHMD